MSLRRVSVGTRCPRCRLSPGWCYCQQLIPVTHQTHVTFIIHHKERYLPSNTANLLEQTSDNCSSFIRGSREEQLLNLLPDHHQLYLYPDEEAHPLNPDYLQTISKPIQLIVPDGTWRQAKKIKNRMPQLQHIPSVKLLDSGPSRYFLRKQKYAEGVSTYEAVAWALKTIESDTVYQSLERNFHTMMMAIANSNPFKGVQYLDGQ